MRFLLGIQPAKPDLVEPGSFADFDAEAAGRDFRKQRPLVFGVDPIEYLARVGDQPGEDIEPAGGALGIGDRRNALRQLQMLLQLDQVHAAALQDRAVVERDLVVLQGGKLIGDLFVAAGQKARANAIGARPEPQVETGRLQLQFLDLAQRRDHLALDHRADALARQQPALRPAIADRQAAHVRRGGFKLQAGQRGLGCQHSQMALSQAWVSTLNHSAGGPATFSGSGRPLSALSTPTEIVTPPPKRDRRCLDGNSGDG